MTDVTYVRRDRRQTMVAEWARECFGESEANDLAQRGLRLLEEATEAFQAAGGTREMAHQLVDYVFGRPDGELAQELGGVSVTLLALAEAAGLSTENCEVAEINRVLSKPREYYAARNAAKNAAGLKVVP